MVAKEETSCVPRPRFLLIVLTPILVFAPIVAVDMFLRSEPSFLVGPIPERPEIIAMIAEFEEVPVEDINLHIVDDTHDYPYILYSLDGIPEPAPVDQLPVVYRALIHPRGEPWTWMLGGGARDELPKPGVAGTFGLTSTDGDTSSQINTVIFGVTNSEAAKVLVTIQDKTHVRDVSESGGYLILLPDKGFDPSTITEFRILDEDGNELPVPQHIF